MTPLKLIGLATLLLTGCSAAKVNNTRLTSADVVVMTDQMAASLMTRDVVAARTMASEPWVVSMDRVVNKTNDIIPDGQKWAFMARLRAQLAQSPAMRQRNIAFVLPPEQSAALNLHEDAGTVRARPTHALTATFYALTNASREGRADTYLCAFQLLDLRSDALVWEDRYEVKRVIERNRLD